MGEVFHQQVGQGVDGGANADLVVAAGQLVDEKHQAAGPGHQALVIGALGPDHGLLMHLARQDARLQQLVGCVEVEVVRRHDAADRCIQVGLDDLVDHRELVAQLAVGAGLVQHAQGALPEAAAHRQDGVILREELDVVAAMPDGGAGQVTRDLTQVGLHHLFDRCLGFGLLRQDDLADHRVHIGIRQLDAHGKAAFELLEVGGAGDSGLAGADEEHLGADVLAAGLDHFLHVDGALAVFADVLLYLVEHHQGEGELAAAGQRLANGLEHVAAGDVLYIGVQVVQRLDAGRWRCEQVGLGLDQGLVQALGHVEVVELFVPVEAALLNVAPHSVVDAFMLEPHDKARHRVLLRQADGLEEDAQQGHAHGLVARAGAQRARRRMQTAVALRLGAEFLQLVAHALWQVRDAPRGGAVVEGAVDPECTQHLDQVRLARAVEAADPHGRLLGLLDVLQVDVEDVFQALFVLAIAHEGFELVPQNGQRLVGLFVVDAGHALVDQLSGRRVLLVDVAIEHVLPLVQNSLSAVIGTAR